jgi:hypothetical protein
MLFVGHFNPENRISMLFVGLHHLYFECSCESSTPPSRTLDNSHRVLRSHHTHESLPRVLRDHQLVQVYVVPSCSCRDSLVLHRTISRNYWFPRSSRIMGALRVQSLWQTLHVRGFLQPFFGHLGMILFHPSKLRLGPDRHCLVLQ